MQGGPRGRGRGGTGRGMLERYLIASLDRTETYLPS
jgi:hypothetical protein